MHYLPPLLEIREKNYKCNSCDFATTQKSQLTVHMSKHLTCDICGKGFGGKYAKRLLRSHLKKHEKSMTYFECGKCKKTFALKCRLKEHMKTKKCRPDM